MFGWVLSLGKGLFKGGLFQIFVFSLKANIKNNIIFSFSKIKVKLKVVPYTFIHRGVLVRGALILSHWQVGRVAIGR